MKQLLCDGKPVYLNTQTGKVVTLVEDWQYKKELGLIDLLYIVPKGYQSDLTSIPKWIRWWGRRLLGENWNAATIAHDYIHQHQFIYVSSTKSKDS